MNKNRLIFYSIFGLFHLLLVISTFYVDSQKADFGFLYGLLNWMWLAKIGTVLGLIMLIVDLFWVLKAEKSARKDKDALTHELNTLKAKLFDMQESSRNASGNRQSGNA